MQANPYIKDEGWMRLIADASIKVSFVSRDYLKGAYSLAKQERESGGMRASWC